MSPTSYLVSPRMTRPPVLSTTAFWLVAWKSSSSCVPYLVQWSQNATFYTRQASKISDVTDVVAVATLNWPYSASSAPISVSQ